jgi:TP901 family phage tail tape measure protein
MADVQSNIHVNIDTSDALASLKALQRQISAFHTQMAKSGTAASAVAANQAQNLMNSINATGQFQASMRTVKTSTEAFTESLEKNKLTSREYFRYTGAATKTFGRLFRSEFETINKVARERVKDIQTQYIKLGRGANGALEAIAVRPLTLDMKNLGTQTAIAAQKQQLLNQLLKQGSTNLLNFGKNTQWAGRQLMVGFTVPLAMLGTQAAKTFMKLEEQAIRFKRVYGELFTTQEETDAMVKQIQLLAKEYTKYGVAVEETMKMAADAAAMGKMGADLTAQVAQATRLAVLGGVEQAQALETTISVTNAFGVATEDLAKKIDFLNAVENQTVVSIEDLTIAIPKAGPVVQQLGGNVEDLAFFLTAMKEGGINASEGANALKSGLASLINPSEKASKFLAGLGVNIKGIVEANAGDVKSTVIDFANALDTLDPLNRARAIEQLFGKFQFSRLSTLFQNVTAEGTQAARVLGLTKATTEELAILSERELSKIENTTTYKFKKSIEDLKVTLAPVGEQFLKALTPIVEFAAKILDKFNDLGDGSKKFLTILTVALGAIGPLALMTFGLLANGLANIIKLFATMRSGFQKAGSSTQVLGQQTEYLTQQQVEASAVAASLDQVHQRLKQTFTSEASAVNNLASAYRNAIAAQLGFTGPVRGAPVKGPSQAAKKYSTGTTRVPGTGNKDTVPSVLTPGEAVIPADVAQDPRFKPIISAMVNRRLQGFNGGTEEVTSQGTKARKNTRSKPDTVFAHANGNTKVDLDNVPNEFKDKAQDLKARGFDKGTTYSAIGFDIPEELHKDLTKNKASLAEYLEEINKTRSVQTMTAKLMGPPNNMTATEAAKTADQIRTNLVKSLEAMPKTVLPDGTVQDPLIGDKHVYSRMGNIKSGILGGLARDPKHSSAIAALMSPQGLTSFKKPKMVYGGTATPEELLKAVNASDSAANTKAAAKRLFDYYPNEVVKVSRDAKGNIIAYERPEVSESTKELKKTTNNAVLVGNKFKGGRSDGSSGTIKVSSIKGKRAQSALAALKSLEEAKAKGLQITKYREQVSQGTGYSNVAAKHLSGVHITEDGRKVYVKPMVDEKSAMAELRATRIAREVHGLETPKQELRVIQDPETGKTMYALESKFDPRFDPDTMPKKFTKAQYFKQLVAAGLRGDKDLKKGNLGGNILTDVGTAGVFRTASGAREYATSMPSLEDMARINLSGVKGDAAARSPFWFGNATADIAKNMSSQQYADMMEKEIDKSIKNLERVIPKLGLTDAEKPLYTSMLERLKEGKNVNWKDFHKLHTSMVIKPDEMLQDENTKKISRPRTEPLPHNVKSDSGSPKDKRLMEKPVKGKSVVQKPRRVGKIVLPGKADAPEATGVVSMPGSARKLSELSNEFVKGAIADAAKASDAGKKIAGAIVESAAKEGKKATKKRRVATRDQGPAPIGAVAPVGSMVLPLVSRPEQEPPVEPRGRLGRYLSNREQKKQDRIAAGKGPGMGMTGGVMAASGVAMMASMVPGQVGEMAQKIMMPLMGISMILPMLQNKFTALAAGVGLVVAAYAYQRMAFDKAQDAALKLTEAMGSGAEAMKNLSTFAGQVSAGEIMDRRRKDSFSPFQIKTGKTTFGQSFMAGEQGKAMAQNVGDTVRSQGKGMAKGQVVNQMATAVASGALSPAQARSIVANLAQEMGDYSFGIEVNGKLNELLGPNGENILKDPIGVRVKLLQDTREKMNLATDGTNKAAKFTGKDLAKSTGFTAAGAGAGAVAGSIAGGIIGALTGSLAGPAGTAVGTTLGVKVGAVAGAALGAAAGNFFGRKDRNKRIGEASGASVAMQKIALQQQQEMLDSVELEYQNKLQVAKAAGDQAEVERLTNNYIKDRNTLLAENGKLVTGIQNNFKNADGATQKALMTGVDKAITKQYTGTALEDVVPLAQTQINDSGVAQEQKYILKMEMASGQIDPMQMIEIFDTFGNDKVGIEKVVSIIGKFGGAFANQMMGVVGMFKDPKQATDFVARISTKTAPEAQKELELFQRISQLGAAIPDISVALDYYNKNPEAAEALQKTIDDINNQKGKITLDIATKILGAEEMAVLRADQEYFDSLPPEQQKVYMQTLTTMVNMKGNNKDAIQNWLKANPGKTEGDYYRASAFAVTESSKDDTAAPTKSSSSGSPTKVDSSPLDELVKKLRDVRKNQIKVTEGWGASQKALNKLFGGSKSIQIFSGIENDMRKLGAGEDLIDLITGMDAKEYEDRKNSLFKFDDKGNIVKIKDNARSIGDAIASIKLGEFVSEQERMSKQIANQTTALTRLKAAGVEGSIALEAVADATFAAAIANKKLSDKEVKKIVGAWKEATKQKKNYIGLQALQAEETELDANVDLLKVMTETMGQFSQEQINAIMQSENLKTALVNLASVKPGTEGYKRFLDVLKKALNKEKIQLQIDATTIDGMQKIFDQGFSTAMERVDVEEKRLTLKFDVETEELQNQIDAAQDKIDKAQYDVDDKEAALRAIEKQEEKINEKYDERIKALDDVEKANAAISAQQKGQLTLAEALTSGDIAAAAKAAQEMRAQQAADAVTKEKEALEKSREYELSRVTQDGKTRKQLEKEIRDLEDYIFELEEKDIEKPQEEIRKKNAVLREEIKKLDLIRREWETYQQRIDEARVNNKKSQDAIDNAKGIVDKLITAYQNETSDLILPAGGYDPGPAVPGPAVPGPTVPGDPGVNPEFRGNAGEVVEKYEEETKPKKKPDPAEPKKESLEELQKKDPFYNNSILHRQELDRIAQDAKKNLMLFEQNMNVREVIKNAGNTPGMHLDSLYKQQNAAAVQKAMKPTAGMIAQEKAVADGAAKLAAAKKAQDAATLKKFGGNAAAANAFGNWSTGGLIPKYFAVGGFAKGTDTVPAMLTPGEFIMSKYAVDSYGVDTMRKINNGDSVGGTVYNNTYTLTVNAKTDANPNDIAQAVMSTIKRVDDRRIRGVALNGR